MVAMTPGPRMDHKRRTHDEEVHDNRHDAQREMCRRRKTYDEETHYGRYDARPENGPQAQNR